MEPDILLSAADESFLEQLLLRPDSGYSSQQINPFECPVCGNEAGKHTHYGGRGCSSCRAFFRRSVQNQSFEKFKCTSYSGNGSRCKIDSKSWKSCRFCRFQKCLESGMNPAWVLNDVERKIRQEKRTKKAVILRTPDSILTEDELGLFTHNSQRWRDHFTQSLQRFYAFNPEVFRTMITCLYQRSLIPYETLMIMQQTVMRIVTTYFAGSAEITRLTLSDQNTVLNTNVALMWNTATSVILGNVHQPRGIALLMDKVMSDTSEEFQGLRQIFEELDIQHNMPQRGLEYNQVYRSPWAPSIILEERHKELTKKIGQWPVEAFEDNIAKVDPIMMYLLSHILLYNTDFLQLEQPGTVGSIQTKYLTMLHRYLKAKFREEANNLLGRGIMIASLTRESYEIQKNRLPV